MNKYFSYKICLVLFAWFNVYYASEQNSTDSTAIPQTLSQVDTSIRQLLGDNILKVLLSPDRIKAFKLENEVDSSSQSIAGYKISEIKNQLPAPQKKQFNRLTLLKSSYWITDVGKRCTFEPHLVFSLKKGRQIVVLLYDLSCGVVQVRHQNQVLTANFDYGHPICIALGNALFQNSFEVFSWETDRPIDDDPNLQIIENNTNQ